MKLDRHILLRALAVPVAATLIGLILGIDEMVIGGCIFISLILAAIIIQRIT